MKKILLSFIIILSANLLYAGGPLKFRAGALVLGTNHWMLSSGYSYTIGLTEYELTPQFTFNMNPGIALGVNFTDKLGVEVDIIFGKYKQDWVQEIKSQTGVDEFKYTTEISKIDIPILFKAGGLMYFEAGPQFTIIQEVEEIIEGQSEPFKSSDYYNSSQIFGVLGTGVSIEIPKIARIDGGLRLGYGFQDLNAYYDDGSGFIIFNNQAVNQAFWALKIMAVHEF